MYKIVHEQKVMFHELVQNEFLNIHLTVLFLLRKHHLKLLNKVVLRLKLKKILIRTRLIQKIENIQKKVKLMIKIYFFYLFFFFY